MCTSLLQRLLPLALVATLAGAEADWRVESLFEVDGLALMQPGDSRGTGRFANGLGDEIRFDFNGACPLPR